MSGPSRRTWLTDRERALWALAFVIVAALLVATQFASDDPDSKLYAELSAQLAKGPVSHWIAPEWWGHWEMDGLFREHPIGVFLLPTALGALGIPGVQAAYIVGIAAGVGSLLLIAALVARATSATSARTTLVLLQLMPVAFIFRIRANHEYPMLFCLLATLVGLDAVRESWRRIWIVPVALTAALLVKGVFVVIVLLAAALWILLNPLEQTGSSRRPLVAMLAGLAVMALVAYGYDAWYLRVTGERFWAQYWERQLGPLTLATPADGASTLAGHLVFYVVRLVWHPAPWSFALALVGWRHRRDVRAWWRSSAGPARRSFLFALCFAAAATLMLSPASRFAERYVFAAVYAIATLGAVLAPTAWPPLGKLLDTLEHRVPALPVVTWFVLMLLRLGLGPMLPRI